MSAEWDPGAWAMVTPGSVRAEPNDGNHRAEATYAPAPCWVRNDPSCAANTWWSVWNTWESDFQAGKINSLHARRSGCFSQGPCLDPHMVENRNKMLPSQAVMPASKESPGPATTVLSGQRVGWDFGCKHSLELWGSSAISKTSAFLREALGHRNW